MFHRPKSDVQTTPSIQSEPVQDTQETTHAQKNVSMQKDMETQNRATNEKENTTMSSPLDQQTSSDNTSGRSSAPAGTGPFQKQGHSVPAGRYGSNNTGYSAPSSYTVPKSSSTGSDRKLTLGPGITMSGEIEACDHLVVEGTVEAALKGAKVLEIAETGVYFGTVEIEEATIAGRFEGDLTVNGRLTICSGGSITGSVSYRELAVEAGAVLDGTVTPLVSADSSASRPVKSTVRASAPANETPRNETVAA